MVERIGLLHLFLNKIELWDCGAFLLSAFETEIREHLELRSDAGIWGPIKWFRKGKRERTAFGKRSAQSQDPQTLSRKRSSQTPVRPSEGWAESICQMWLCSPPIREGDGASKKLWPTQATLLSFSLLSIQYFWLLSGRKVLPSAILVYLLGERNILFSPKFDHWEQKY